MIALFEQDPETELIVMVGEIGGDEEERTAEYIAEHVTKPVVAYIAGFRRRPGKRMGHAGAIISGSSGTAQAKAEALEAKGVPVGRNPTEAAQHRGGAGRGQGLAPSPSILTAMASPRPSPSRAGAPSPDIMPAADVLRAAAERALTRGSRGRAVLRARVRVRAAARVDRGAPRRRAEPGRARSTARSRPG